MLILTSVAVVAAALGLLPLPFGLLLALGFLALLRQCLRRLLLGKLGLPLGLLLGLELLEGRPNSLSMRTWRLVSPNANNMTGNMIDPDV